MHLKANTIGCFMLNGIDTISFPIRTKSEDFCDFLVEVRNNNPVGRICLLADNFATHKAKKVREGYILYLANQSETSFQLIDRIDVGGKMTDVVYQFQKVN